MSIPLRTAYAAAFLCCMTALAGAEEATVFQHKMEPSDRLIYEVTTDIEQMQNVNGMELKNKIRSRSVDVETLVEVDDAGNQIVQTENKRLEISVEIGPLGKYTFDSQSTNNETASALGGALTPLYETLSGAISKSTRTLRGDVVKVEGLSELLAGVLKDNPIASQFAAGATDEGAVVNANQLSIHFPEKAIKPGDTWDQPFEMTLQNLGTFNGKTTYTYDGAGKVGDRQTAKFIALTDITIDLELDSDGAKVTGSLASTESKGTIHFDPAKGQLVLLTGEMKLSGSLTVEAGGQTINIDQSQTQTLSKKLLDKLPEE